MVREVAVVAVADRVVPEAAEAVRAAVGAGVAGVDEVRAGIGPRKRRNSRRR